MGFVFFFFVSFINVYYKNKKINMGLPVEALNVNVHINI